MRYEIQEGAHMALVRSLPGALARLRQISNGLKKLKALIFERRKMMLNRQKSSVVGPADAKIHTILGKESEFEGKLSFEGTVRIDGKFAGEIFTKGKLVIGEGAAVNAEIEVDNIIISGEVKGNINAKSRVEIHSPGKLKGNIQTPILIIEEGVIFEGNCQMEKLKEAPPLSLLVKEEAKGEKGSQKAEG